MLSSSKVIPPSALRANGASRILSGSVANVFTASFPQYFRPKHFIYRMNFSTVASATQSSSIDRKVVKAFKSEIKSQQLSLELNMPAAPADFPFIIHDEDDGSKEKGKLTRKLNGEKIYVSIAMPGITIQQQEDLSSSDPNTGAGLCLPEMLNLYVKIGKQNGKFVDFGVFLCPHVMHVEMMSVTEPAPQSDDDARLRCFGPHHVEEEGELQSALQEYLKVRGIKTCYAEFMYKYMVWKSKHTTLNSLTKLKKFIED